MNGTDRLERELTTWFADTAAPRVPDYTADILGATATMRQRPRWSFPTRWLPAGVVLRLPRLAVRPLPWRAIALLAVLGLLLAAALTLYVGSRPRVPPPFGPAANGLVVYTEDGDIWTVDPETGVRTAIVTGIASDSAPRFSRDGTRLAFLREETHPRHWLVIANADGSGQLVSRGPPFIDADTDSIAWAPDGRWVALTEGPTTDRSMSLVDTGTGEVRDLETPDADVEMYWRPPDGRQLMYVRRIDNDGQLTFVDLDADSPAVPLGQPELGLRPGGWTPDGNHFVVHHWASMAPFTTLLDPETGDEERLEIAGGRVSNDGTRVVGYSNRVGVESLCVMSLPDGACEPIAGEDLLPDWEHTAGLHWSPDDRWIAAYPQDNSGWVLLDPDGGPPLKPAWSAQGLESWQRVAPSGGLWGL